MANKDYNSIKRHGFSETDPKVRVELKKNEIMLQKELEKLEKQTQAKTNIISDHQQALKMSWRRLELQRKQEWSPNSSRKTTRHNNLISDTRKKLLFANATTVALDVVPNNTENSSKDGTNGFTTSESAPFLSHLSPNTTRTDFKTSPYISSPYEFRRHGYSKTSHGQRPMKLTHQLESSSGVMQPRKSSLKNHGDHQDAATLNKNGSEKMTSFLLPPLNTTNPGSQSTGSLLTASSNTVKKETLMKAKKLMNFDSKSYNPTSFQQFYSSSPSATSISSQIILASSEEEEEEEALNEEELMKTLTEEEKESFRKAKLEVNKI